MWALKQLQESINHNTACIKGKLVPARPLNYTKTHTPLLARFKRAWDVFICKADCFVWPAEQ